MLCLQWLTASQVSQASVSAPGAPPLTHAQARQIDALMQNMSVRDKIGQMMMCDIIGKRMHPKLKTFLDDVRPGGITLFNYNIGSPNQLRELNRELFVAVQTAPPFLTIDQEGGDVSRLREDIADVPGNMALGATRSEKLAESVGNTLGEGLAGYGFNMNLAPVLDVNTNPKNPIIGTRSFSSDPKLVGRLGAAYIRGLQSRGVIAAGKHFPGHGDVAGDSHMSLPVLHQNSTELHERELVPFREAIQRGGLSVIMTAHIALPGLHNGKPVPATLSKLALTDILRKEMKFDGIIMTDGLEMQGLLDSTGSIAKSSVLAVLAGADMISVNAAPEDVLEARDALLEAVAEGVLRPERVDASVRRILSLKARYGILQGQARIAAPDRAKRNQYATMANEVSSRSATLVKNDGAVLPLNADKYERVLVIGSNEFVQAIRRSSKGMHIDAVAYSERPASRRQAARRLGKIKQRPDVIVIAVAQEQDMALVKQAAKRFAAPVALVSMGSPYILMQYEQVSAYLCLFSKRSPVVDTAVDIVLGRKLPQGRLPVAIPGLYPYGHSVSYTRVAQQRKSTLAPALSY